MAELFAADPALGGSGEYRLPRFSLQVSAEGPGGWRTATLVRDTASPAFFLRSISAPWPFVIARPKPSTRQSPLAFRAEELSPVRSSPMQKLAINWAWERADDATEHLRFFVCCRGPLLLWPKRKLTVRLGLKQHHAPQQRMVLQVSSEPIDWRQRPAEGFAPSGTSSPAQG